MTTRHNRTQEIFCAEYLINAKRRLQAQNIVFDSLNFLIND